ncbi:P-loop NTPase fold protein [Corallococcus exiguus]|nr:P-loop NTPase fold protein [Corallococcus exiguus]
MATLLAPGLAITTDHALPDGVSRLFVNTAGRRAASATARIIGRDPQRDLALLELVHQDGVFVHPLAPSLRLPQVGVNWQSHGLFEELTQFTQPFSGVVDLVENSGLLILKVDGSLPEAGSSGSPIVSEGRLIGVLRSSYTSTTSPPRCIAIPTTWLRESHLWPLIEKHLALDDEKAASFPHRPTDQRWFERLSPSARQVVSVADAMRQAVQSPWYKILLEYLVTALAEEAGGPLPGLMQRQGISLDELRAGIRKESRTDIPPNGSYKVSALNEPPELSSYAREALDLAAKAADTQRSDHIESTHLLHGILSVTESPLVQAMAAMGLSRELIASAPIDAPILAGFSSDGHKGTDRLNLTSEVQALVSVLAASDVVPPLSLGLFGDWGSGKSFFMHQLEQSIGDVAKTAAPGYCKDIVQIRFNAWSYIDTQNLWASLASEIFKQLAEKVSSGDPVTAATKRAQLLAATDSSRNVLAEAEQQKEAIETSLQQSEELIQKLENEEANLRADLREVKLSRTTLQSILEASGLQKQAEKISEELQLPLKQALTPEGIEQLRELRDVSGRLRAYWRALWERPPGERQRALLLLFICLSIPVLAVLATPFLTRAWHVMSALLSAVSLVGFWKQIQPFLEAAKTAAKKLETAWDKANTQIEETKQTRRQKLEEKRTALSKQLNEARKSVDEATTALHNAEAKLDALRADRKVSEFIRNRHQSTDYTQHLGVLARAQHDFEELTKLIKKAREEGPSDPSKREKDPSVPPKLPRIDRIILYIDDLDRCPEDKVVEVLQAVHLLLAFELFVVVVGVDSRWLLHSLQQNSKVFQSSLLKDSGMSTEEQHHWQSTPLNYLEKIFQIPYALRSMEPEGFGSLIDDLTGTTAEAPPATVQAPVQEVTEAAGAPESPSTPKAIVSEAAPHSSTEPKRTSEPPPPPPAPLLLSITDEERRYMKSLHGFIPSPRAAKRFVNTYRLLHASLPASERAAFVGGPEHPGEYRYALLLLAMIIGHPAEATRMLALLVEQEPPGSWWTFVTACVHQESGHGTSPDRWAELGAHLEQLQTQHVLPENLSCDALVKWAPRVARYSFQARSVLLARRKKTPSPNLTLAHG